MVAKVVGRGHLSAGGLHSRVVGCAGAGAFERADGGVGVTRSRLALAITLLGFALLTGGVAVVYWPAGVILAGVLLLAAGLFGIDVEGESP